MAFDFWLNIKVRLGEYILSKRVNRKIIANSLAKCTSMVTDASADSPSSLAYAHLLNLASMCLEAHNPEEFCYAY